MKKILLLCDAGMSTSLMVKKMKEAAVKKGVEVEINALSIAKFQENLGNYDVFLLGPQVKYKKAELAAVAETVGKKVEISQSKKEQDLKLYPLSSYHNP